MLYSMSILKDIYNMIILKKKKNFDSNYQVLLSIHVVFMIILGFVQNINNRKTSKNKTLSHSS